MNFKRLAITILVVFVAFFASDYLIHSVWLMNDYKATASLWRPEAEMGSYFGWMLLAHLLFAVIFVVIWVNGFPITACLRGACVFGVLMGLFIETQTIITYVVQPLPATIAIKWFAAGIAQGVLLGAVAFLVYRPATAEPPPPAAK